ncbi:MAG: acylphosphatase, partial [Planctomycetota bacterium]
RDQTRMSQQRRIIHFSGTVQGVGFRFTAIRVAVGFDVTGYVRNVRGGRVEVVVEGEPDQIDAFTGELCRRMEGYIRDVQQQVAEPTGQYGGFDVRY